MNSPWLIHGLMALILVQIWLNFRLNGLVMGLVYAAMAGAFWSLGWMVVCFAHNLFTSDLNDWRYLNLWTYATQLAEATKHNTELLLTLNPAAWSQMSLWPGTQAFPVADRIHMNLFMFFAYAHALGESSSSSNAAPQAVTPAPTPQPAPRPTTPVPGSSASLMRHDTGHIDYRAYVDANSVRNIAVQVVSPYAGAHGGEQEKMLQAAALFEYVKSRVNYVYDPITMQGGQKKDVDFLAAPADTLQIGGGDCDDQALLMASLLSAVGLENRILFVDSPENGAHLLTQFAVDASLSDDVASILDSFYEGNERVPDSRSYLPFVQDGRVWLIADTTRDYVGDFGSLVAQGFIQELPDGRFQWHTDPVVF
ncbi:MAG: hypothetical protein RI884_622 [Pseudomonadota bacterium]